MRRFILFITLLFSACVANAGNLVCENKTNERDYYQCYQYAVKGAEIRMQKNYQRIVDSPRVSKQEKDYIPTNHRNWAKEIDKKCSDILCAYEAVSTRNEEIAKFMAKYGIPPA